MIKWFQNELKESDKYSEGGDYFALGLQIFAGVWILVLLFTVLYMGATH